MIQPTENHSLKSYNTFGLESRASFLAEIKSEEELISLIEWNGIRQLPVLILGGGSNILFTKNFEGLVIKNAIKGKVILNTEIIKAASGEIWHELVLFSLDNDLGGIENLSLIPGLVGAAPIQNIGAYGVELKDVFVELEAIHLTTGEKKIFTKEMCAFGYRDSVFKREEKGQYFILSVTLKLNRNPEVNTSYGAINKELEKLGISNPTIKDVSHAVITIRQSKLPDPREIGNAGSFFKNPEIDLNLFESLQNKYPDIPSYPTKQNMKKLAAGWLIEQCGWKGKKVGNTGCHKDQALVLVNYGNAKGTEIKNLASEIIESVYTKFGVSLEAEVNIM